MSGERIELCNVEGRAALLRDGRTIDLEQRSRGHFSSDPMAALQRWDEFCHWTKTQRAEDGDRLFDAGRLGPCVPRPSQVFAIGLNYREHAKEIGLQEPKQPMTFTKFPSCLAGAEAEIPLTSDKVDWEVELVVVIGKPTHRVSETQALEHVAGFCVGQDISDRALQFADAPPQFSLGKSAVNYGPIGPSVVAREHVDFRDLSLSCDVNGRAVQRGHSDRMIFTVPAVIAHLSRYCILSPGDLIFTGTPGGVAAVGSPRRYLQVGDVLRSEISGLGRLENRCIAER